jgi:hypothetical protein
MGPGAIRRDVVESHLQRVLAGPGFVRNERLSRFLRFLVEQQLAVSRDPDSVLPDRCTMTWIMRFVSRGFGAADVASDRL